MPNPNKIDVLIENPLPGGSSKTSLKRAQRFVRNGRAVFTAALVIRFVENESQRRLVELAEERLTRAITGRNYDQLNANYFQHASRLPLLHAEEMLVRRKRPSK